MAEWQVIAALTTACVVIAVLMFCSVRWVVLKLRAILEPLIKDALYSRTPFTVRTSLALPDAEARLKREVHATVLPILLARGLVGSVHEGTVQVAVHHPLLRNSFSPVLDARFTRNNNQTWLTGSFGLHALARGFMAFWFWSACLISLVLLTAGAIGLLFGRRMGLLFIVFPPVLVGSAVFLVWFSRCLAKRDEMFAAERIREAISGTVA